MARSVQPKVEAALGNLYFAVLRLQTELDEAHDEIAALKKAKTEAEKPDPPKG